MRLGQLIESIRQIAARDKSSTSGRKEQRFDLRTPVAIRVLGANGAVASSFRGWMKNLSHKGVGVTTRDPIKTGTFFLIRVPSPEGTGEVEICYLTVRCEMVATNVYQIGGTAAACPGSVAEASVSGVAIVNPTSTEMERIRAAILAA